MSLIPSSPDLRRQDMQLGSTEDRRALSMLRALQRVLSPIGFPYASGYHLFKDAYFGRDSLEVAEDLLEIRPDIARTVIVRLAALQGGEMDPITEEQPGKIHHEYRALTLDGKEVDAESRAIFRKLAEHWQLGRTPEELDALTEVFNYSTVDATPLYVRLVSRYCDLMGTSLLGEEYAPRRQPGTKATIRDSVRWAVDWIVRNIEASDLCLLEFQRMTPRGHRFQAWKDGTTSYLHTDGTFANYNGPIASIEVQGLAYDALVAASRLLPECPQGDRDRWARLAATLRDTVMELFWMPAERFFAMALDRDPDTGSVRQVRTITSNPGALLDSGIFDTLSKSDRERAVGTIVERIYSEEFLTPAGVRCNSLEHRNLLRYMAYQSSYTVWHKETYDIARGFRRQGFPQLASDLEVRLLNAVNLVGGATEFLYAMPDGHVDFDPFGKRAEGSDGEIQGTNVPENDQAWSISAALAIKWRRGHGMDMGASEGWQHAIEEQKRSVIPPARILQTLADIKHTLEASGRFSLNLEEGWQREHAFVDRHELPAMQP